MRCVVVSLVLLVACTRPPVAAPAPRVPGEQFSTLAEVEADCPGDGGAPWAAEHVGLGVLLDARHVLTAEHIVRCPELPVVHVTVGGRRLRVVVEVDDYLFGSGQDVARLEVASGSRFERVAPPELGVIPGAAWCAVFLRGMSCGRVLGSYSFEIEDYPGDSGAPVYAAGRLVGLVRGTTQGGTQIVASRPWWTEGL